MHVREHRVQVAAREGRVGALGGGDTHAGEPSRVSGLDGPNGGSSVLSEMDETVGYTAPPGQDELVAALRAGDETTFVALVDELGPSMLRVAMMFVSTRAVAEEVVQEAWLGVLSGIGRFEGRSSLKTWIFRILTNRAKTRGEREGRSDAVLVPRRRRRRRRRAGGRSPTASSPTGAWTLGARVAGRSSRGPARRARRRSRSCRPRSTPCPETQRAVITLRDVEGWSSEDVRNVLGLSESNQRVLLHRARSKVRQALEAYLEGERS